MLIEVTHRGYTIRFNENSDEWYCSALEGKSYSAPKLSTVKAAIDRMLLSVRKASAFPCFEIGGAFNRTPSKVDAKVIEFVKTKIEHDIWNGKPKEPKHIVASIAQRGGSEKPSRREVEITDLMPDTSEAHAAFARFEEACARESEARAATQAAFAAIPRVTIDMIPELVRIAQAGEDGESK